jgi:hypothetical protein
MRLQDSELSRFLPRDQEPWAPTFHHRRGAAMTFLDRMSVKAAPAQFRRKQKAKKRIEIVPNGRYVRRYIRSFVAHCANTAVRNVHRQRIEAALTIQRMHRRRLAQLDIEKDFLIRRLQQVCVCAHGVLLVALLAFLRV